MSDEKWIRFQRTLDFLRLRKRAYQFAFGTNPVHHEALKDLAKFCRVGTPLFHENERMTNVLIGRQEVFYRITQHLKLEPEQLFDLYNKPSSIQPKE